MTWFVLFLVFVSCLHNCAMQGLKGETAESATENEIEDPHRNPSLCEVCKFLTEELNGRLLETGKTKDVIETGYGFDSKKKKTKYNKTELRFIEALTDPHVCDKILEYNVHAERKGSLRFSKGRSQTMGTLHNLVDKGVKVDLGIPYELWDTPSASVTDMQRKCFTLVEEFEDDLEDWYFHHQEENLTKYLCQERALRADDQECLSEEWNPQNELEDESSNKEKSPDKEAKKSKSGKDEL